MEQQEKKDIFDRMFESKLLKPFEEIYKKNKEVLLYLLFGGLTTVVSIVIFAALDSIVNSGTIVFGMRLDTLICQIVSWIGSVTFAYVTNRIWVFETNATKAAEIIKEAVSFYGGRVFTLIVETVIISVFADRLGFKKIIVKIVANVIVIVLNYIISKLFVFKKSDKNS